MIYRLSKQRFDEGVSINGEHLALNYGDKCWMGYAEDYYEITEEDIKSLRDGKVLLFESNEEYTVFVRLKEAAADG